MESKGNHYEVHYHLDPEELRFIDLDLHDEVSGDKVVSCRLDLPTISLLGEDDRTTNIRNIILCAWGLKEFFLETATELIEVSSEVFMEIRTAILDRMLNKELFFEDEANLTHEEVLKVRYKN